MFTKRPSALISSLFRLGKVLCPDFISKKYSFAPLSLLQVFLLTSFLTTLFIWISIFLPAALLQISSKASPDIVTVPIGNSSLRVSNSSSNISSIDFNVRLTVNFLKFSGTALASTVITPSSSSSSNAL